MGLFFTASKTGGPNGLGIVIFSKDRPMQLDALLRSIKKHVAGKYELIVQWNTSHEKFNPAYADILKTHSNFISKSIKEENFKKDLIKSIENFKYSRLMFLVDDILFVNDFQISCLNDIDLKKMVPSIRLWPGINHTQTNDSSSPAPELTPFSVRPWSIFSWIKSSGDWAMPLSVDGNIFDIKEMLFLLKRIQFKAPNTLEKSLGPYRFIFKRRNGICLQKPAILNFALNRVNIENSNFACGDEYTSDRLLSLWNTGNRMDFESMQKIKSNSCHIICDPIFINSKNI